MLRVGLPNVRLNSNKNNGNTQKKTETKMYHLSQDTLNRKIMVNLNKIENNRKVDIKTDIKTNELHLNGNGNDYLNRNYNGNGNGNNGNGNDHFNDNPILDGYKYSYARLSYLYKSGKLTKEQLLDLKAQKQGFKNHYERVLMRYMEVVKSYKFKNINESFKDAKEKHRLFKQMKAIEGFLREKEREKEAGLNGLNELNRKRDIQHIPMSAIEGCC